MGSGSSPSCDNGTVSNWEGSLGVETGLGTGEAGEKLGWGTEKLAMVQGKG